MAIGILLFVALLCSANSASAEKILFKDAIVHTVSGETFSPGEVLIDGAKILEVGAKAASKGAKVISLKGLHLYPGLTVPLLWGALVTGCIGSHMPRRFRHWSILEGREVWERKTTD